MSKLKSIKIKIVLFRCVFFCLIQYAQCIHPINRIKGQYKICWLKRCLGCKYEWNYVSLISILYLLNNKHFCQTKWSYKTLFTPISAIKKLSVSKGRKEWQKFSIVTGSLLFIIIGGRFLTVTIFSWEMFTVPYCC